MNHDTVILLLWVNNNYIIVHQHMYCNYHWIVHGANYYYAIIAHDQGRSQDSSLGEAEIRKFTLSMKSTKKKCKPSAEFGRNIGIFGLKTTFHAYVLGEHTSMKNKL